MKQNEVEMAKVVPAALAAGSAYLASMWLDNRLSSHPFNDLKLVGQIPTTKSPLWQILGVGGHYGFSVVMGYLYARYAYPRLPGPGWLRGFLFLQVENALLYPAAIPLEPRHTGMQSGQVPTLFSVKSFKGQLLRHVSFGVTLGLLYNPS